MDPSIFLGKLHPVGFVFRSYLLLITCLYMFAILFTSSNCEKSALSIVCLYKRKNNVKTYKKKNRKECKTAKAQKRIAAISSLKSYEREE